MKDLLEDIREACQNAIDVAYKALIPAEHLPFLAEVTQATQSQYGHYQCNSALKLAKILGINPREVATTLTKHLDVTLGKKEVFIDKMEVAGAGFINFFLNPKAVATQLSQMLFDEHLGIDIPKTQEKIIVEFSSPNVAKELHVGHLRSTIIGDAIARVFEFLGYDVLRLNHIGDWGTQFGMLIAYLQEKHPEVFEGKQEVTLPDLMNWYKLSKLQFDSDPAFKKRAQNKVVELQSGDSATRKAWERICEISRKAYQEIYDLLDIHLKERGESFYNPYLKEVVEEVEKKGLITLSDGAKCVFLEQFKSRDGNVQPVILQKRDGGYNYATTDLAALKHRLQVEKADRIISVTDAGQSLHFQMVEAVGRAMGYFENTHAQWDHVPFGVVLGSDGKKFKTRSGDVERLMDLLTEAIDRAFEILKARLPELSNDELRAMAKCLGINAVKYADLSTHRLKDYMFSYDRMLRFEGNTAAFLLYSYVRAKSILRKCKKDPKELLKTESIVIIHPSEMSLAVHLREFGEVLKQVVKDLLPNRLADYLYTLAEKFNIFFRDCRVEKDEQENSRLLLCELTAQVLEKGLNLLGLKVLTRM